MHNRHFIGGELKQMFATDESYVGNLHGETGLVTILFPPAKGNSNVNF